MSAPPMKQPTAAPAMAPASELLGEWEDVGDVDDFVGEDTVEFREVDEEGMVRLPAALYASTTTG